MPANPFSPFRDPSKFLCSFFDVDVEADRRYADAASLADNFQQRELTSDARKLFDEARR
jgi:hypothetical protein